MTVTQAKHVPQEGCYCAACHWARTGERPRAREESMEDLVSNYAMYRAGLLVGFDTYGALAGPIERE